jgi:hypothetical protein
VFFLNSVLRRIFGHKKDEILGVRRKLHIEELHNLYTSPSIIRILKSRWMGVTGHVALTERIGMQVGFWWGSQEERDH